MLRKMFGAKRVAVTGGWRNCIIVSFMVCIPCIRLVKPLRVRWARHVAPMG